MVGGLTLDNLLVKRNVVENVGFIKINNPPVNAMSVNKGVPQSILDSLQIYENDSTIKFIVILGEEKLNFSGGADISEFGKPTDSGKANLRDLIDYLDKINKPCFAIITGPTMGGGLELALGCHFRLADQSAKLALPEVKLGILPGAGGTQRLPRLIGVEKSLPFMVEGSVINAKAAKNLGIVDELIESKNDLDIKKIILEKFNDKKFIRVSEKEINTANLENDFFSNFKNNILKKKRGFPAPFAIVDCVEKATTTSFSEGMKFERQEFQKLVDSVESAAQRYLFFSERAATKMHPPIEKNMDDIKTISILGAGTMGTGIAISFMKAGFNVFLFDKNKTNLEKSEKNIFNILDGMLMKNKISEIKLNELKGNISFIDNIEEISVSDLVIEAVFEEFEVKKEILSEVNKIVGKNTIIASNTSTLDINNLSEFVDEPQRFLGLHFFSPAHVMKLLEIVKGSKTSLPVLNNCIKLAKKIGKVPVTVGVCDGFVGNRMIHRYLKEANHLLEEGALPKDVDDAIEEFGFAMGPFKMSDLAGLDIGWAIRKRRKKNNLDTHKYSNIPDRICEGGDFGQKTGKGYYDYSDGPRNPKPNETTNKIIVSESDALNITRRSISKKEIVSRLMLSLITEGLDLLDENIASRPSDIDVIYSYGYGFPRYRGGPMFHANTIGVEKIVSEIEEFSKLPNCDHWKIGNRLLKIKNGEINFI